MNQKGILSVILVLTILVVFGSNASAVNIVVQERVIGIYAEAAAEIFIGEPEYQQEMDTFEDWRDDEPFEAGCYLFPSVKYWEGDVCGEASAECCIEAESIVNGDSLQCSFQSRMEGIVFGDGDNRTMASAEINIWIQFLVPGSGDDFQADLEWTNMLNDPNLQDSFVQIKNVDTDTVVWQSQDSGTDTLILQEGTVYKLLVSSSQSSNGSYYGYMFENDASITLTVVPEPAAMSLLVIGGLAMLRRRRR